MTDATIAVHHCHLERSPADTDAPPAVYGQRSICACGWIGTWFVAGARAVEEGTAHCIAAQRS